MSHKLAKLARKQRTEASRQEVDTFLRNAVKGLRLAMAQDMKALRQEFPNAALPCHTCAFRTTTDSMGGFDKTVLSLAAALMAGQPFYCHTDPQTNEPFPSINGEYAVPEAIALGHPVNLCAGASALMRRTPDEIVGIVADAIVGYPMPRPLHPMLYHHVKDGLIALVADDNKSLRAKRTTPTTEKGRE